jgi:diguanylate cyclase (GGDEF)-like protein
LRAFAERLRANTRETDHCGRRGGDEFVVALEAVPDEAMAERYAQRLLDALTEPVEASGEEIEVSASIGMALLPDDAPDVDTLLHAADKAMYEAKHAGGRAILSHARLSERSPQ